MSFSSSEDATMCELVGQHPCLFDLKSSNYKDQNIRENVWAEIAEKIGKTADACKKRWKNIKDTYNRSKRGRKVGTGSSSQAKQTKWALADVLSFLDSVSYERQSQTNTAAVTAEVIDPPTEAIDENMEEEASATKTSTSTNTCNQGEASSLVSRKKRKTTEEERIYRILEERSNERKDILAKLGQSPPRAEEDNIDLFFKSMAMTVKMLPPPLIVDAKKQIFSTVMELEEKALAMSGKDLKN